jgi:hypothetical protein
MDTTRNGPAWISTCADTSPRITSVTMPEKRFRAEEPVFSRSMRCSSRAKAARSAPRMMRRSCSSRSAGSLPLSTQRLRVSALTPIRAAASPIR